MDITIKKLTECTVEEAVKAWNKGFEGYFVKIDMTPDMFFTRLINEGLSMQHSIVAFDKEEPVGIVLNGFRTVNGIKTAWNGGTGVAVSYRGKGVSQLLMAEILNIYQEQGAGIATLEAIKENRKAIRLYEKNGYNITDTLVFLSGTLKLENIPGVQASSIRPEQLPGFPFYKEDVPWQRMWHSVKSGEAQIYYNQEQQPIGYSLFKRAWDHEGRLEKIFIYQLELLQDTNTEVIQDMLAKMAESTNQDINIITINASVKNPVTQYLLENGFKITTEQVQMVKKRT